MLKYKDILNTFKHVKNKPQWASQVFKKIIYNLEPWVDYPAYSLISNQQNIDISLFIDILFPLNLEMVCIAPTFVNRR